MPCTDPYHDHGRWPTDGKLELRIEACERQCGWCKYKIGEKSTASNLRKHAQKHITNDKSLYDIIIVPSKAGRPKVGRRSRPAAIPDLSDKRSPFEAHGSDTTPDSGRRNRSHANPHQAYLDPNKAYRVTNEAEYLESTMTRSGSNLSSDPHLQELERRADMAFRKEACDHIISLTSERDGLRARVQFLEITLKELGVGREEGSRSEIWPPLSIDRDTDRRVGSYSMNWQAVPTSRDGHSERLTQTIMGTFTTPDHSDYYSESSTSLDQNMAAHLPMKQTLIHQGNDIPDDRSQRSEIPLHMVSDANATTIIRSVRGNVNNGALGADTALPIGYMSASGVSASKTARHSDGIPPSRHHPSPRLVPQKAFDKDLVALFKESYPYLYPDEKSLRMFKDRLQSLCIFQKTSA